MSEGGTWKIDDIQYGGDWEFANRGRLSETLASIASYTPEP